MDIASRLSAALLILALLACEAGAFEFPPTQPGEDIRWSDPEHGLSTTSLAHYVTGEGGYRKRIAISVLRLDPACFDFRLYSSRWEGGRRRTLPQWAEDYDLTVAANAGMFLKDKETSTGYMRSRGQVNNPRIAGRFGAFFVSSPRVPGLPRAAVLDRSTDDWETLLPLYDNVVQNFRLMKPGGGQLWPRGGPKHAVSAVAEDLNGRILFLHCATPVSVHDFVEALNAHGGLNLNSAMYTEGGSEASLLLRLPGGRTWFGHGFSPAGLLPSSMGGDQNLPNILGAVRAARP